MRDQKAQYIELNIPRGFKLCGCGYAGPGREFTGNQCYGYIKPKRDKKYFKSKLCHEKANRK